MTKATKNYLTARNNLNNACRSEGSEAHRLGTMSPATRRLWATLQKASSVLQWEWVNAHG